MKTRAEDASDPPLPLEAGRGEGKLNGASCSRSSVWRESRIGLDGSA